MICEDANLNREVHQSVVESLMQRDHTNVYSPIAKSIAETIVSSEFPGALLPFIGQNNELEIIAVTAQQSDWYKLSPVLKSYCGPSFSSYDGQFGRQPLPKYFNAKIASKIKNFLVCHIRLATGGNHQAALKILQRAVSNYLNRPNIYSDIPLPISFMLRNFEEALLLYDKLNAKKIIQSIEDTFKLDSMNLKFMEIQMYARFGEWNKITKLPNLRDICFARKTPVVLNYILSALRLSNIDKNSNLPKRLDAYEKYIRPYTQILFNERTVGNVDVENSELLAFEAYFAKDNFQHFQELDRVLPKNSEWRETLREYFVDRASTPPQSDPVADVFRALSRLKEIDSIVAKQNMQNAFAKLTSIERDRINEIISIHTDFEKVNLEENLDPENWVDWFERLSEPDYTDYARDARSGATEWPKLYINDQNMVYKVYDAINIAIDDPISSERIIECLPFFVKWMESDEEIFSDPSMTSIFSGLLTLLALRPNQSSLEILGSSQILVSALLNIGVDKDAYVQLLSDLDDISGDGIGASQVYWLLELVEELYQHSSPDSNVRSNFFHKVAAKIKSVYNRLTQAQTKSVNLLFHELELHIPEGIAGSQDVEENRWAQLENKKIGIYTLNESAGRRAGQILKDLEPSLQVSINSQHAGSDQLKALSENSDYFVISWLSAKHAATDFIRQHRPAEDIIYATGKGASSIVRCIEVALR